MTSRALRWYPIALVVAACAGTATERGDAVEPTDSQATSDEAATSPEATGPSLEEDVAPDGPSCGSSDECEGDAQCRGPAGCSDEWACGAARECGTESVAFCGCDMATFYARQNCPGQPYVHAGPCEQLGEEVEEETEEVEGNRICTSNDDCRSGFICAGTQGCSTLWTCVPRGRMRPRCGRQTDHFCSCDGQTFEASASCPGRSFLQRGYCPGDEPVASAEEPDGGQTVVRPPPTHSGPIACVSNRDCPRGLLCTGTEGCTSDWVCARPRVQCTNDTQYFCGCGGESFRAPMNCPGRPHRHRGSCPR
ncbi:MAG: hypothetical protein AB7S26_03055 [Sandaracinaceae bacterium]